MYTAATPTRPPTTVATAIDAGVGSSSGGTANTAPVPWRSARSPPATAHASATGVTVRALYSVSSSSIASRIEATGVPKIAVIPAAAPAASRTLRSRAVTSTSWPIAEPSAPPVAMIGPSAPNGPPVPIATAADSGLRNVIRSGILLSFVRICSIASGMPWPRIAREPKRAIRPTMMPPITGTSTAQLPSVLSRAARPRRSRTGRSRRGWWRARSPGSAARPRPPRRPRARRRCR